jgi:hypothetical protein
MKALLRLGRKAQGVIDVPSLEIGQAMQESKHPDQKVDLKKVVELDNGHCVVVPNYLSPTSIAKFYKEPEEAFNTYSSVSPPDRFPQTFQMMFGSAFDGAVKNFLQTRLLGEGNVPAEFQYEQIIRDQCERQFWDKDHQYYNKEHDAFYWAEYLLEAYKQSGALQDLMIELLEASELPRFEFTVTSEIKKKGYDSGVVLLGKPDVYFKTKQGNQVIYDWKCNGIYSRSSTSPKKEFMRVRDGWLQQPKKGYKGIIAKNSRSHQTRHKEAFPEFHKGMMINGNSSFQEIDATWAAQLCTYGWLMGEDIGSDFVLGIDQLCGAPGEYMKPKVRVASHRSIVKSDWQHEFYNKAKALWDKLQVGHVFINLSKEESDQMVAEMYALYGNHERGSKEEWLANAMRVTKYGHVK